MSRKTNLDATATTRTLLLYTQLLFSGRRYYLADLTRQFGCSKPTIMRMMQAIEGSGVAEIASGLEKKRRWYQLKRLPGSPHIGLSQEEVEQLALCRDLLERLLPRGIEQAISDGLSKISTLMSGAENRAEATAVKGGRVPWGRVCDNGFQDCLEALLKAIPSRTVCEVVYRDLEYRFPDRPRQPVKYNFVPCRLVTENDTLNVEGWKVNTGNGLATEHPITFSLHRILSCLVTERIFSDCPPLPEYQGAFGLVGFAGFAAKVRFSEEMASYVRERVWSPDQTILDLPDGEIELCFTAADEDDLARWVLSFGCCAELREPERMRRYIAEEVKYLREYYAPEEGEEDG
ncbi:MAG: WYL domain-containing protein [Deltaproteobacteria bacterium]|jgi:predicted DNA-binding transcriptional regulator YafY|nr:WYL domain-containing protein [Deltaproteobacteria bacterium]